MKTKGARFDVPESGGLMRERFAFLDRTWFRLALSLGVLFAAFGFLFCIMQILKIGGVRVRQLVALVTAALGIVRMLIEREGALGSLPLSALLAIGNVAFQGVAGYQDPTEEVAAFMFERLANALRDQGYTAQEVDAVFALRPEMLAEVPRRLDAVRAFSALPEAAALAAANKRVGNILKKSDVSADASALQQDKLVEPAEIALAQALDAVAPQAGAEFNLGNYTASLKALAALKAPVDAFFDQVMVNAEDPALRANRLALLARLQSAMNQVADLSRLAA